MYIKCNQEKIKRNYYVWNFSNIESKRTITKGDFLELKIQQTRKLMKVKERCTDRQRDILTGRVTY